MIRKYSLIIEGDDDGYSGYVPELPTILVTGSSRELYRGLDFPGKGSDPAISRNLARR